MLKFLKMISYILVIIGALNWGLVGAFNFNLVTALFGDMTLLTRAVYVLVGISAVVSAVTAYIYCKEH